MKCPNCERNHPRGKEGMACICGYGFLLDPKSDGYTDGKFLASIRRASANGTYVFTKNQLYAAACRGLRSQNSAWFLMIFVVIGAVVMVVGQADSIDPNKPKLFITIFGLVFFTAGLAGLFAALFPKLSRKKWEKCYVKWRASGKAVRGLIEGRQLETPPPDYDETDLYDYGVEQVVICERDELVDWLVLNRYHFNARAAVIGESGYPSYLLPKINELLAGDDPPKVCLLHDASDHGQEMRDRVERGGVFELKKAEVIDMGISPEVVSKIRSLKVVRRTTDKEDITADMIPFTQMQTLSTAAFAGTWSFVAVYESGFDDGGDSGDGDGE